MYRWPYNAAEGIVGDSQTLVTNMSNTDVSEKVPILAVGDARSLVLQTIERVSVASGTLHGDALASRGLCV